MPALQRFPDFSSLFSAQDKNPSQELTVLLEVDGVLMDAYRLGNRQTFNAAFKKLGLDCAICLTSFFLTALISLGTFEYGCLSFSSISEGSLAGNSSSEFIKVFGIGTSSSSPSAAGGNEMIARGTGSKLLNLYSAINQALHITLETDPQK
ncbi:hypothetical protein C1H46_011672 [Malus baccata]|uniref:Uncharacterized protein n=1 Tax=Malus baccata TaxID=106549 RepID=A0A540MVC1_MALBA|nr:hypothetical protein C1H46_011672 [Malus baccata]